MNRGKTIIPLEPTLAVLIEVYSTIIRLEPTLAVLIELWICALNWDVFLLERLIDWWIYADLHVIEVHEMSSDMIWFDLIRLGSD